MTDGRFLEIVIVLISGVGGAAFMTLFLRLINDYFHHGVRVPLILGQVVHHYFSGTRLYRLRYKTIYGHLIHLTVGVLFAICYTYLWNRGIGGPTALSTFIFGLVNGLVGMFGWFIFLRSTFEPEQVDKRIFFPVIVIAHLFFALGVTSIYHALRYLIILITI